MLGAANAVEGAGCLGAAAVSSQWSAAAGCMPSGGGATGEVRPGARMTFMTRGLAAIMCSHRLPVSASLVPPLYTLGLPGEVPVFNSLGTPARDMCMWGHCAVNHPRC